MNFPQGAIFREAVAGGSILRAFPLLGWSAAVETASAALCSAPGLSLGWRGVGAPQPPQLDGSNVTALLLPCGGDTSCLLTGSSILTGNPAQW